MRRAIYATAAAVTISGAVQVSAQDIEAGEDLYRDGCRQCHGPTARGMASFPRLTGQTAEYLVLRLEQYRAGEKVGPNSALMTPVASDLSDGDIANIAAFIAGSLN